MYKVITLSLGKLELVATPKFSCTLILFSPHFMFPFRTSTVSHGGGGGKRGAGPPGSSGKFGTWGDVTMVYDKIGTLWQDRCVKLFVNLSTSCGNTGVSKLQGKTGNLELLHFFLLSNSEWSYGGGGWWWWWWGGGVNGRRTQQAVTCSW